MCIIDFICGLNPGFDEEVGALEADVDVYTVQLGGMMAHAYWLTSFSALIGFSSLIN